MQELLTTDEMRQADQLAISGGVSGSTLMAAAGRAVFDAMVSRWAPRPVHVLCGPGNNGGDGLVVACLLADAGWPVTLFLLGEATALAGDAADAARHWTGPVRPCDEALIAGLRASNKAGDRMLVVDALFGAGLTRPLDGLARRLVEAMAGHTVVAVDVPSGIDGNSGQVLGAAPQAELTVTFFRRKPGHWLLPGRALCGELVLAEIGIPAAVLDSIAPRQWENDPALWAGLFPWPRIDSHKYARGHALIAGSAEMTGATCLAGRAALRVGAGLVTLACPPSALPIHATLFPGALLKPLKADGDFAALLDDPRRNAIMVGPGGGLVAETRSQALAALSTGRAVVLDADALTVFQNDPDQLFSALGGKDGQVPNCLLTPHEGEFSRLFPPDRLGIVAQQGKMARVRAAARLSGAVILLKGADTVIAAPDGRVIINHNAPPDLATAGSGDVLAGLALGLLAQGMAVFEAAAVAAWLHGEAGRLAGPGLIAEDLPDQLPAVLKALKTGYPPVDRRA